MLRQAILTYYVGQTNTKPARVKAIAQTSSITLAWDNDLSVADNHRRAALSLMKKLDWDGSLHGGWLKGKGCAWVID